jgi:hypothetical protein
MNTLCWSLTKSKNDPISFHPSVYDMYYLSIAMAKQLGYHTVLYGNSDAIENLREIVDSVVNIDFLDFQLYDDVKVYIWHSRIGEYVTIDGDVFLYERLKFRGEFDNRYKISVENTQKMTNKVIYDNYTTISNHLPNNLKSLWATYRTDSFNTGIVKWNDTSLKKFYIESYHLFRNWYIQNKNQLNINLDIGANSHIICEHLLYKLLTNGGYSVDVLKTNSENNYSHFKGFDKFNNPDKWIPIKLLVDEIKHIRKIGLTNKIDIKKIYLQLEKLYRTP